MPTIINCQIEIGVFIAEYLALTFSQYAVTNEFICGIIEVILWTRLPSTSIADLNVAFT